MQLKQLPITLILFGVISINGWAQSELFRNPDLPMEDRINDLISQLTLDEKIAQLNYDAPAIDRLNIPSYNWWNEALHGIARNGRATVFPQAIGLAATFDDSLLFRVATAISDEARAKYEAAQALGNRGRYTGLTFWSPNVNIYRDPRWGRGQETYGEDPYLTSRMGVAFVKGLQGDHPTYLKAAACAKHYVVHSGPEGERHTFNATPPRKDFHETYLPAFEALVKEADVEIVMCAYNRTYDEPCCGSSFLLQDILREQWGFDGHVTSDCWALVDFHEYHKVTQSPEASAALAFRNGVNVNCGSTSPYLKGAIDQNLISEEEIDQALYPLLRTRFRLGLMDPPERNPFADISPNVINSPEHQALALQAAEKSVVLLKNDGVLPLKRDLEYLYVIGPNATNGDILLGNYNGVTPNLSTVLEGIAGKVDAGTKVDYRHGFLLDRENINPVDWASGDAKEADATVVVMGLSGLLEGEEGESLASPTKSDRFDIRLPQNQVDFLKKLRQDNTKPLIVVLTGGSPVAMPEVHELADAVLYAWYPGEAGGTAIANILFGDVSPSGRLPITFPRSVDQLPPYEEYAMPDRTYRYMQEEPLYPFGFGLSYTQFTYQDLKLGTEKLKRGDSLQVQVTVKNTGNGQAEEVVQCYLTDREASVRAPLYSLKEFRRVCLAPGQQTTVTFTLPSKAMQLIDEEGNAQWEKGEFQVTVGGASPGERSVALGAAKPVQDTFELR
ncbi:MAG: glycoside hydrolase family 3 C-terminal domain-containing protein [Cyclobacteriaceae bacterium]